MKVISINGQILDLEKDAKISVLDRGFLYGDSVYEVTEVRNGKVGFLKAHLDRLQNSALKMHMHLQLSFKEYERRIIEVATRLHEAGHDRCYIRLVVTRGEGEITLDPQAASNQNVIIIGKELPENPTSWYDDGVEVIIASTLRNPVKSMDPNIKSGNYLNNILAYNEAKEAGYFDAIMLNQDGNVTECTTSNIWIVKDGIFKTPPIAAGLLKGITRENVIRILGKHGIAFEEVNFTGSELKDADECFLTSSTKYLVPIVKVDDTIIGNGKPGCKTLQVLDIFKSEL
ncbi:putative branched-chain-amino-acid transaminase [Bacteriovorax sp. BAL6_X]|uniref:aminotransferase class IV n=1 Tax=Bacteriovorax sp. BAL6_X TaxID=1201290 RepID=UPI00038676E1|nr:aminotransferase class IV [Bacteriovorax sp. BAL6_X]EPZ49414.1 putative branched-chain-amino-acid transaminase [Bacteriovorax sp. BAL6_X]